MTAEYQAEKKPQSWLNRIIGLLIRLFVFWLVFFVILPIFIDYQAVWEALEGLTAGELAILAALSAARIPTEALIYRAMLPGLHIWLGSEAFLSQNFAGTFMPTPTSSVIQYAYFRSDGFERRKSLVAAIGSFIFPSAGRIVMPLAGCAALILTGAPFSEVVLILVVTAVVIVIAAIAIFLIGRSDSSAQWVGDQGGRFISWTLVKFRREPIHGLGRMLVNFRKSTYSVVADCWRAGMIAVAINLTLTTVLFIVSMRLVGVSNSELSWAEILAALSIGFFAAAVIPITSSGLGSVDLILIAVLTSYSSGDVDESAIVAGQFVWRIFYSIITVPFGAFTLARFQKKNPGLIKDAWDALDELREEQAHEKQQAATAAGPA